VVEHEPAFHGRALAVDRARRVDLGAFRTRAQVLRLQMREQLGQRLLVRAQRGEAHHAESAAGELVAKLSETLAEPGTSLARRKRRWRPIRFLRRLEYALRWPRGIFRRHGLGHHVVERERTIRVLHASRLT